MAMGKRRSRQEELFVFAEGLPKSGGHPFYKKLNELLAEAEFDRWIEGRCEQYYEADRRGRPSMPPGVYFRMLLVGYFENIDSQRGIAWRCADSLALRKFLGIPLPEDTPDHSTLSVTRGRLPKEVFDEVFQFVLRIAEERKLLSGKTVGVDSTTLEANAAMKSIVRRDTGEDWKAYVTRLMRAEGVIAADEKPTDEALRRFDKARQDKQVSNDEWKSKTDDEARITKMKDGRTHLAYKAEHVVDLDSDMVLSATVHLANHGDAETLVDSVMDAQINLKAAGSEQEIEEVAADKGYHKASTLELAGSLNLRTYIPEPRRQHARKWTDKPAEEQKCVYENRRRMRRVKGKRLQKLRSERVERTFAHVCETGGGRRSWLRGLEAVGKRHLIAVAGHNLGRILWQLFGIGKPRSLQGLGTLVQLLQLLMQRSRAAQPLHQVTWRLSITLTRQSSQFRPAA